MNEQYTIDPGSNPLLAPSRHPRFDLIKPEHAEPAVEHLLTRATEDLCRLESSLTPTWDGLMYPLRKLHEPLDYAWSLVHHYMGVMNSLAWRDVQQKLQPKVVAFSLRAGQSEPIYEGMTDLRNGSAWAALSGPRQRVLESAIRGARLAGVGLDSAQREEFNSIQEELAKTSTSFSNNLLDATKAFKMLLTEQREIAGLPVSLLQSSAQAARAAGQDSATTDDGPWLITLEIPSFVPFMKYSECRDLREKLYRSFVTRASDGELDNGPLLERVLELRQRQSELLGFKTYAEVSLESKMAPGVDAVDELLETLRKAAISHGRNDLAEIQDLADKRPGRQESLMNWDVSFWAERLREERFLFNDEDLRPYFQFQNVLDGLFELTRRLFGIVVSPADGQVPVWHPDVRFFRVFDQDGSPLSSFYLDPYSRPETKRGGAWMDPAAPRERMADGKLEEPVAYLVCNQTVPVDEKPSLMTFNEVTTLFHEFGHSLQHMLTIVDEPDASGLHNVEWDAVELASQFMENWCYHRVTLKGLTSHVETGETIPDELFEKLASARVYRAGSDMLRQLLFGIIDMELHHRFKPGEGQSVANVKKRIAELASVMPLIPEDRFLCGFAHIFAGGYAAGYYSYKWAEVLSADAFAAFEEAGLDNSEATEKIGRQYRDTILALGGGTHPMEVFRAFRGRDPDPEALLRHTGLSEGREEND
ncbi:MAG: M3 family metallopeptidase [Kiritimatiellia bacterium]|jgi:oligopeptidase A|nr:M3 family metallopeptidase [Kiritimatiellia bacterium]MDP6847782.1 M3 family metallopeptidase [Kiritimatiellia bacterium]